MLTTLNHETLQALRDNSARESVELDFKSDFNADNTDHRRGLIEDVCAMANARGGWLLLGVAEDPDGAIAGLPGIQFANADGFRLRIGQMIEGGLEPRLAGVRIECVPADGGRWIAGIRVPQSWTGPHRTAGGRRFMVRADARNTEYDMHGLRQAFTARDQATRAWETFRDDRIARYYAGRLPLPIQPGPAALIHLHPLGATTPVDMASATAAPEFAPPENDGRAAQPNFDGVIRKGHGGEAGWLTYVQVFHRGVLEAFRMLDPQIGGNPGLVLPWLQRDATGLLPRWLAGLQRHGVAGPYEFAITLVGVRGQRPLQDARGHPAWGVATQEDTLALPAWFIDPVEFDGAQSNALLEELRVQLHRAFGRDGIQSRFFELQ
ncbi:helix-turn-helix domain-containing protein [Cupriavidus sp. WS]|uniref:AlbA family DNA-binding domain-containing protein n=1 Tax=Cupriavidus sp. WS TaxID=1312922 RepID=UPI000371B3E6|nr:ATP-binding protein [Cupriavidus sp. WS]